MKHAYLVAVTAIFFTSCAERYYSGGGNHIPAFTKAKQVNVGGGFHLTDKATGFQIQSALAATNRLAFMANAHTNTVSYTHSSNNVESIDKSTAFYGEGATGFFIPSENQKHVFETYAGYGFGSIRNSYEENFALINYNRIFLQPSFSFFSADGFSAFSFAMRFSHVNIRIKDSSAPAGNVNDYYQLDLVRQNAKNLIVEPTFQYKFGKKHQGTIQLTITRPLKVLPYSYDAFNFGIGYIARLQY